MMISQPKNFPITRTSQPISQYITCCVAVILLNLSCASFAEQPQHDVGAIRDLSYGNALFHFYLGDYFTSATRLLIAKQQQSLKHHVDDADLLLAGLYLSYGQQNLAADIFSRLLDVTDPRVRDRAWLYLAEIAWQRGNSERARDALSNMGDALDEEFIARQQLLQARLAIEEQNFPYAIEVLSHWEGGDKLSAYAKFNLGVALVRHGQVDKGSQFLEQIGKGQFAQRRSFFQMPERFKFWSAAAKATEGKIDEDQALRDKANLALGFAHLQKEQPRAALKFLSRVNQNSALKNKANLAAGWAATESGNPQRALEYWNQLRAGDRLDPAVQEAMLAIPFANQKLGHGLQALDQYQQAIKQFEEEIDHLNNFQSELDHGAFVKSLLADDKAGTVGWFWQLKSVPDSPQSRYLYHLVADHAFQEGLKNYRDLVYLKQNLLTWRGNIDIYRDMLQAQRQRYAMRVEQQAEQSHERVLLQLQSRVEQTEHKLHRIESDHDTLALLTDEEHDHLCRLDNVKQRLLRLEQVEIEKSHAAHDKYRLLNGLIVWQAEQNYSERLWQTKKKVRQLKNQLAKALQLQQSLQSTRVDSPQRFDQFEQRIESLAPRIDQLTARIDKFLHAHQGYLADLAQARFEQHKQRLRAYVAEAQFALAAAYDATASKEVVP